MSNTNKLNTTALSDNIYQVNIGNVQLSYNYDNKVTFLEKINFHNQDKHLNNIIDRNQPVYSTHLVHSPNVNSLSSLVTDHHDSRLVCCTSLKLD